MKTTAIFLLCLCGYQCLRAQQNLGIRNSNYAGIQGALLNPSSIADSKLKWDVNVLSGDVVFDNTFLSAPKHLYHFLGFKSIIEGSIHEDLFNPLYDPQNPNKRYNVTFSTEVLGPSFFIKVKKKHQIGMTIAGRSYANIKNISGNLAQNSFAYFLEGGLWNTDFQDHSARVNSMSWLEYGLHYATVIYSKGKDEIKAGISLNYLQGVAAAYAKNTNINYKIVDTTSIVFTNSSIDYGRTEIDDYNRLHRINHGHGFGADIGFTYVHLKDAADNSNYLYRLGLSILDIGAINFNTNAATFHLQTDNANFSNWHQSKFTSNNQLDQTLSAVFYNGDSSASHRANRFRMGMPSAISVQGDWNVYKSFFANATIIKGFGHGSGQGVTRPDIYSLTPRYETKWGEVSIPMSLLYYNQWRARLGLALRAGYFFIGGDAPGSLLKFKDLEGADFYMGLHFFVMEKSKHSTNNKF